MRLFARPLILRVIKTTYQLINNLTGNRNSQA
jgi:hypothetical protein